MTVKILRQAPRNSLRSQSDIHEEQQSSHDANDRYAKCIIFVVARGISLVHLRSDSHRHHLTAIDGRAHHRLRGIRVGIRQCIATFGAEHHASSASSDWAY
jgi:hypothetical protein